MERFIPGQYSPGQEEFIAGTVKDWKLELSISRSMVKFIQGDSELKLFHQARIEVLSELLERFGPIESKDNIIYERDGTGRPISK